jgi:hypothetical protein
LLRHCCCCCCHNSKRTILCYTTDTPLIHH